MGVIGAALFILVLLTILGWLLKNLAKDKQLGRCLKGGVICIIVFSAIFSIYYFTTKTENNHGDNVLDSSPTIGDRQVSTQTRSFVTVDCDNISSIEGELLFLRSANGFIRNKKSGSRLQEAVPQEVGGDRVIPGVTAGEQSVQTIVIQQIPTKDLGFKRIEGGIPGKILFVIAGGVIGALAAAIFRKNPIGFGLGGLLLGYLASIVIMSSIFGVEDNDMAFTVDNASDSDVSITFGEYPAVAIPARSLSE